MKIIRFVLFLSALLTFSGGCASIVDGGPERISISSTPKASFKVLDINNNSKVVFSGFTPATVKPRRSGGYFKAGKYDFVFTADGYKEQTVRLEARLNGGWYIVGNLLFINSFRLIGWLIVDPITGAMWTFGKKDSINVGLEKSINGSSSYNSETRELYVLLISDPRIQQYKKDLVKIN